MQRTPLCPAAGADDVEAAAWLRRTLEAPGSRAQLQGGCFVTSHAPATTITSPSRRVGRSIAAVFAGFLAVVVLSLGTDEALHLLKVYPPWGEPMYQPGLNLLALTYRGAFTLIGGYLTARLAPHSPMRHVLVGSCIGLALGIAGVFAATGLDLGPIWYPVAVAISGPIFNWLGGVLYVRQTVQR
jgi:hypothetical protein